MPKGGPDGGDGGKGGSVIFMVNLGLRTLQDLYKRNTGQKMAKMEESQQNCKDGEDLIIKVPPGTLVKEETGRVIADRKPRKAVIARGGRGGA